MAKRSRKKEQPAASLPEDLLVEILARVPYRSLCRFKCVSRPWRALCSDPGLRKRSPQGLSGFFCYGSDDENQQLRFLNISGRGRPLVDPGLPFLRRVWDGGVRVVYCCGGLLLCQCLKKPSTVDAGYDSEYIVCNPATEEWTALPATEELHPGNIIRMGFDPATPSRFTVFVFVLVGDYKITRVEIFSSETGKWTSKASEWGGKTIVDEDNTSASAFFGGALHLTTYDSSVITVDTEGNSWRKIRMPLHAKGRPGYSFIAQSHGCLYAMHTDRRNGACRLSVWVLEDYASGQWNLKHTANLLEVAGRHEACTFVAVDPECKVIFFQIGGHDGKLVSYDMRSRKFHVIFSFQRYSIFRCEPYVPNYTEWLSDGLLRAAP